MWDTTQICLACQQETSEEDMGEDGVCWDCGTYGHENGSEEVEQIDTCPSCGSPVSEDYCKWCSISVDVS